MSNVHSVMLQETLKALKHTHINSTRSVQLRSLTESASCYGVVRQLAETSYSKKDHWHIPTFWQILYSMIINYWVCWTIKRNWCYPVKRLNKVKLWSWFWAIKLLRNGYRGIRLPKRKLWAENIYKILYLWQKEEWLVVLLNLSVELELLLTDSEVVLMNLEYCKISNLVLLPLMIPLMIWLRKLEKGRTCLGPKFKNY